MLTPNFHQNNPVANKRVGRVAKYIKSERLHVDADRRWTRPGQRNIGPGWERSPMASIVVNATPATSRPNGAQIPPFGTSRASLARALAIRAKYRLCGTLFEVGQGARMDALELIDNSKCTCLWLPIRVLFLSYEAYFEVLTQGIYLQIPSLNLERVMLTP